MNDRLPKLSWCLVAVVSVFPCGTSLAQELYPSVDRLLQEPTIRNEVGITDKQMQEYQEARAAVAALAKREYEQLEALQKELPSNPDESRAIAQGEVKAAYARVAAFQEEKLESVFQRRQIRRLKELQIQAAGVAVISHVPTCKELGITEADCRQLSNKRRELDRQLKNEIREVQKAAAEDGIPLGVVLQLWSGLESGPRRLDYALDNLTEEQEEAFNNGLRKSFDSMQQRRIELKEELLNSLTEPQLKKLKEMQGRKFDFPEGFSE